MSIKFSEKLGPSDAPALLWKDHHVYDSDSSLSLCKRLWVALSQPSCLGFQAESLKFISPTSTPLARGSVTFIRATSFCSRVMWQAAFLWALSRRPDAVNRNKRWKARCLRRKHHAVGGLVHLVLLRHHTSHSHAYRRNNLRHIMFT